MTIKPWVLQFQMGWTPQLLFFDNGPAVSPGGRSLEFPGFDVDLLVDTGILVADEERVQQYVEVAEDELLETTIHCLGVIHSNEREALDQYAPDQKDGADIQLNWIGARPRF